jgi:hypothetical protein
MSKVVKRRWTSDFSVPSKPDRRSCEYEAYVPDDLLTRQFRLDGDVAAEVADAETSIARLNVSGAGLVNTEALARILLRAEAVASSRIEGLDVGARRLLHAEIARRLDDAPRDVTMTMAWRWPPRTTSCWPTAWVSKRPERSVPRWRSA